MEITEKQNLENMERCPRWKNCSIPKCPLDFDMEERVELPEDSVCPMRRYLGKTKSSRMKTKIIPALKGLICNMRRKKANLPFKTILNEGLKKSEQKKMEE